MSGQKSLAVSGAAMMSSVAQARRIAYSRAVLPRCGARPRGTVGYVDWTRTAVGLRHLEQSSESKDVASSAARDCLLRWRHQSAAAPARPSCVEPGRSSPAPTTSMPVNPAQRLRQPRAAQPEAPPELRSVRDLARFEHSPPFRHPVVPLMRIPSARRSHPADRNPPQTP